MRCRSGRLADLKRPTESLEGHLATIWGVTPAGHVVIILVGTVLMLSGPLGLTLAWHKRRVVSVLSVLGRATAAVFVGPLCLFAALIVPSHRMTTR
jgi:hypothetical protein